MGGAQSLKVSSHEKCPVMVGAQSLEVPVMGGVQLWEVSSH